MRRLADRQDEAAPVYARMNRVADYFDELWQAGIKPKEFVRLLHDRTRAVACIEQGQTGELDNLFLEMRTVAPKAASIPLLEAAASVREFNYPAAQRALATAVRLRPGDGELLELSRRVTTLSHALHAQPAAIARPPGRAEAAATRRHPRRLAARRATRCRRLGAGLPGRPRRPEAGLEGHAPRTGR
jgi:hypothetical protein